MSSLTEAQIVFVLIVSFFLFPCFVLFCFPFAF